MTKFNAAREAPMSVAAEAWELFWEFMAIAKPHMAALAAEFDLSPQQTYALKLLAVEPPLTMGALAEMLGCDASNVTSIVDRLETRGFVERRSSDTDRRVKALVLTEAGWTMYHLVLVRMRRPPAAIESLSPADQTALRDILRRALAAPEAPAPVEARRV